MKPIYFDIQMISCTMITKATFNVPKDKFAVKLVKNLP